MALDCRFHSIVKEPEPNTWAVWVEFYDTAAPGEHLPKGKQNIKAASQAEFEAKLGALWDKAQTIYAQKTTATAVANAAIANVRANRGA